MSNESWKRELDVLMKKIEQYSSDSLLRIKRECDHTGLPKGEKFRKMFLGITNTRIAKAFDKLERGTSEWGSRKRKTDESHSRDEGRCRSKSETYSLDRPSTSRTSKSTKSAASDMRISKERRDQSSNRKRRSGESVSREMDKSGSHQIEAENRSGKSGDSGSRKIDKGVSREMDKSSFREMDGKSSLKKTEVKSPTDLPAVDDGVTVKLHPCTLKFACVHCEKSKSLSPDTCSDNIETIYGHWLSAHTDLPNVHPFQFYVTQLVACHFCDQLGPFHEVIQHQITSHPNNSRIIVNESIRHQCALCDHSEDLADHFDQTHKVVIPNPFQVTDDVLDMLLKIDIHKKVECGHCNVVFETHHEFDHHHLMEHSGMEMFQKQLSDQKTVDIQCNDCSQMFSKEDYFNHLEEHSFNFKCTDCDFRTNIATELLNHGKTAHNIDKVMVESKEVGRHLKEVYWKSKTIFSNGLMLSNFNLKGTRFDESPKLGAVLEELKEKVNALLSKKEKRTNETGITSSSSESDSDTFSSELSTESSFSFSPSVSSVASRTPLSQAELYAELRKQNELVNNLSITGIPRFRNENLWTIFDKMCDKLGAPVTQRDVSKIFRTAGPQKPIIIKLKTWTAKANIKRCFKYNDLWSSDVITLPARMPSTRVFVNLHTTRFYGKMLKIAKHYKKMGVIQMFHLCDTGLLVKSEKGDRHHTMLSKQELLNWVNEEKEKQFKVKTKRNLEPHDEVEARLRKYRRTH